jgi:hypothetical protein
MRIHIVETIMKNLFIIGFLFCSLSVSAAIARVSVGQTVYMQNGPDQLVGVVQEINTYDMAAVLFTMANGKQTKNPIVTRWWPLSDLYPEVRCTSNNICEGEVILESHGPQALNTVIGTVIRTFQNDVVEIAVTKCTAPGDYKIGNIEYSWAASLSKQKQCSGTICVGDTVFAFNGFTYMGKVLRIFNETAEVHFTMIYAPENCVAFDGVGYWPTGDLKKSKIDPPLTVNQCRKSH